MSGVCQGTKEDEVYNCFLTDTGEYRKIGYGGGQAGDSQSGERVSVAHGDVCPFCPTGKISVLDDTAQEGFSCVDGAKVVTPGTVAPNQVILAACIGSKEAIKIPGYSDPTSADAYKIKITKKNT